jgi:hypothetical protein
MKIENINIQFECIKSYHKNRIRKLTFMPVQNFITQTKFSGLQVRETLFYVIKGIYVLAVLKMNAYLQL